MYKLEDEEHQASINDFQGIRNEVLKVSTNPDEALDPNVEKLLEDWIKVLKGQIK
jgi:hypothetical protein